MSRGRTSCCTACNNDRPHSIWLWALCFRLFNYRTYVFSWRYLGFATPPRSRYFDTHIVRRIYRAPHTSPDEMYEPQNLPKWMETTDTSQFPLEI